MQVKVCSPDGDTDFFDIVVGVLQGDMLAPYLFIICLEYVLLISIDLMKENGFTLTKARNRQFPAQTITDTGYTDVIALLANIPAQAESLLHNLDKAAGGISVHVNADKTEYIRFNQNQKERISTLKDNYFGWCCSDETFRRLLIKTKYILQIVRDMVI